MTGPLIVGAGPTGLAAALFLARLGVECRIIDEAPEPAATSKALGVNPRTLSILAETGLDQVIMAEGRRITALDVHDRGRRLARLTIDFAAMGARHPMVILPQARTEALLAQALQEAGVRIERGVRLETLAHSPQAAVARLVHRGGRLEEVQAPVVLGADGAHSAVRHALGVEFPGEAMPEDWGLMDVALTGPEPDAAWIDFQQDGPWVALPYDDETWRLIGFGRPLLERLPAGFSVGEIRWQSAFKVSHRMADRMCVGRVCLAGDAAHIHSPIGARGMNLGIEDAFVFAHCARDFLRGRADGLAAYGASRHAVDKAVVARVERLTNAIRAVGEPGRTLRRVALPVLARIKPLRVALARQGVGLDHPLTIP